MKTIRSFVKSLPLMAAFFLVFFACDSSIKDVSKNDTDYEIASPVYATLAEKSLDFLFNFELESYASMLSENITYEFPDGEKIIGKTALINHWKTYKNTFGIESMKIQNANYLPIDTRVKSEGSEDLGVKVVADFTNKIVIKGKEISVKMSFCVHFDKNKMIDRLTTYYDTMPIKKASEDSFY